MGLKASTWSGLPQSIAKGEIKSLSDFSPTQVVEILQKICHDALIHFQGLQPRYFLNKDLPASKNFNALSQWSKDLMQISKTADHPFQAGLMLEALVSQAQRALISKV
jgi:DNA polymerase-3 subunit delta'